MTNQRLNRLALNIIKIILSAFMLGYAAHEIDVESMRELLARQNPLIILGAFSLMILQFLLATFRWKKIVLLLAGNLLLSGNEATKNSHLKNSRFFIKLNFISSFFNSCLPGTIGGDFMRAMLLRSEKTPLSMCVHSVIIDRLFAIAAVCLMVACGIPWLIKFLPSFPLSSIASGFLAIAAGGIILLFYAPRLTAHGIIGKFSALLINIRRIVLSVADFLLIILLAILSHGIFCITVVILLASLGETLSIADSIILVPMVLLLTTLPISIGGWGVRELGMVGLLALAGISKNASLAVSVQIGLLQMIISLPGAWFYIRSRRKP